MFNLAAIPSDSTGNSTEQDVQEQVGRHGTTYHVRGRFSNETTRASRGPASHVLLVY